MPAWWKNLSPVWKVFGVIVVLVFILAVIGGISYLIYSKTSSPPDPTSVPNFYEGSGLQFAGVAANNKLDCANPITPSQQNAVGWTIKNTSNTPISIALVKCIDGEHKNAYTFGETQPNSTLVWWDQTPPYKTLYEGVHIGIRSGTPSTGTAVPGGTVDPSEFKAGQTINFVYDGTNLTYSVS